MTEERTTERLLQLAGRRPDAAPARAARVRANVYDAWRGEVRRRMRRRQLAMAAVMGAVAASAALVIVVRAPERGIAPAGIVATVERVEGTAPLQPGMAVRWRDWIVTGPGARVALRAPSGTSIRLDEHSRARLVSERMLEMTSGTVYVDTAEHAPPLEIHTPQASIADIGTQFEVRVMGEAVRVRVRSGVVSVNRDGASIRVEPNTELTLTSLGAESRAVPGFGEDWHWTTSVAPPFAIEGRRLNTFLEYLARENGWRLRYQDAALEHTASTVVLHGSVDGLDAEAALSVALTIADLSHTLERGELRIWRSSSR